jgi:RNA polymerase sigma factor (sigma-70 family)
MAKDGSFDEEDFNNLLNWLDEDRERAGQVYLEIQSNLIRIFARRGCSAAEELADETMSRVTRKASDIAKTYVGNPRLYFYGVARNIYKEYMKKQPEPLLLPDPDPAEEKERRFNCLDSCLGRLDDRSRDLILAYYMDEKRAKIDHRKELAKRLGFSIGTLRMRAHRIKIALHRCVSDCLRNLPAE